MSINIEYTIHHGRFAAIVLGTALAFTVHVPAIAETAVSSNSDAWQFEITPYMFATGLKGQVGVKGVTADVDMSFSDIWDTLDRAYMALFMAQKGRWSYSLENVYFKISDEGSKSVTGPFGNVTVDGALKISSSTKVYQGSVGYRVMDDTTSVDLIGGVRYTQVKADMNVAITTTPGIVFPGSTLSADGSEDWVDGVVGVRVLHPLSNNVSLLGYADVGAGGSDMTYQMIAGVNWEFAKDFTAKAGYRVLDWDYENDGAVWDMQASGTYLGIGFKF